MVETSRKERQLRLLLPEASERVNLFELYSRDVQIPPDRPFVRVNMVSTLDGAVAFSGRAGSLGGPGDKLLFSVLRSLADVVLVGAGTVRVERYGPAKLPLEAQEIRQHRGQAALPTIAVVTRSGVLDFGSRLFTGDGPRPIVIAADDTRPDALASAAGVAEVLRTGTGAVDLASALRALGERGLKHVLCEGGPTLNSALAAAQLVDELCLTLSPKLTGCVGGELTGGWLGSSSVWSTLTEPVTGRAFEMGRPFGGPPLAQLLDLDLAHVVEEDSFLFLRLRAHYNGGPPAA
ncbi:MAG: pyrimidine reductase family protein [Acidimicrobiales bacterium]|jgi:riboflavin biosynthesis pyrimidine reductase